jgi:hypothetical protein
MRFARATVALTTLLLLGAAPVPKHLMKDRPYWPTAVGTKWVYDLNGMEEAEEITGAEEHNGGTRLTVRCRLWDNTVDVSKEVVIRRTLGQFRLDAEMVRFPLKAGDSWAVAQPIQEGIQANAGTMTVGETKDVSVPAGKFRATKVTFEVTEVNGQPIAKPQTFTYWYARGVGTIRVEWDGGEKVLKSFTPPRE